MSITIVRTDYLKHYIAGYIIASMLHSDRYIYISPIATMVAGVSKEVYDKVSKKGDADVVDCLCTIAGGLTYFALQVIKTQFLGL